MKNVKKYLVILFIVSVSLIFMRCSIFWYNATDELYEYNSFKEQIIEEMKENPDVYKKQFNIDNEDQLTEEIINDLYTKSRLLRYVFIASASLPISIIASLLLFSPVFIGMSFMKKYRKYHLSIDDFKKNTGYYRDLLKDYNPLELSYNNNYNLDDNSLIAMILYLEKKKVLYINDGKFIIDKDNTDNLDELEKKFIDNIVIDDRGILKMSKSNITFLTDTSCKRKKLIIMNNIPKKKIIIDVIKSVCCYVFLFIIWKNVNKIFDMLPPIENTFLTFTLMGLFFALLILIFFYPFVIIYKYLSLYILISIKHPKRTDLGNDVNYKLEGLKNFIRDFSLLDERTKEEIVLWDDYLIYSVLFGDNKKIYNEMKNKIEYI